MTVDVTLMRACSTLFLFRSLAAAHASSDQHTASQIEEQIMRLMGDLGEMKSVTGFVLLAKGEAEVRALAKERKVDLTLVDRVCREGAVEGAVPLYVRG